jgi:hypothetical protein
MNFKALVIACLISILSVGGSMGSDVTEPNDNNKPFSQVKASGYLEVVDSSDESDADLTLIKPDRLSCLSRVGSYLPSLKTNLVLTGVFAYTGLQYYMAPQNGIVAAVSTVAGNLYALAGGAFLGAQLFAEPLKKQGYSKWLQYAPTSLVNGSSKTLQDIVCRAEAKKGFWPITLRRAYEQAYTEYVETGTLEWIRRLDYYSRLPTGIKKFDAHDVLTKATKELATYNEETRSSILMFLNNICTISNSALPLKRRSIFFLGEAGTGKTQMGKLIANCLGVHMHLMNMAGIKAMDLLDENKPGHILSAFTPKKSEINYWNNVILVDEVDKALCAPDDDVMGMAAYEYEQLKAYLLKLQDEDTLTHESRFLHYNGVDIDFSSAILIFAGNKIPKDESFLTRAPTVRFAALPPELKLVIAFDSLKSYLGKLKPKNSVQGFVDESVVKSIVEADKKFPGVRAMKKVIENYALHLVNSIVAVKYGIAQEFNIEEQYKLFLNLDDLMAEEAKREQEAEEDDEDEKYVVYSER